MNKLEQPSQPVNKVKVERPYFAPALLLGTSSFTAAGWQDSFYPPGTQPNKNDIPVDEFRRRLRLFLNRLKDQPAVRFAVEIRNKAWLDRKLVDLLGEHNVALALTDHSYMPRPWERIDGLDLATTDFVYVRWLGDRKGIEALTTTWNKTIVDRTEDLRNWAELFRQFVSRNLKVYAYANNHYAGHGPGTVKLFWDSWQKR